MDELKPLNEPSQHGRYDRDYFERGAMLGISGYTNYSWMPEMTLRMAHHLIQQLPIHQSDTVLDFGCAKGFLVQALRILDVEAYGMDVSEYAISEVPRGLESVCRLSKHPSDISAFDKHFNWLLSKDVFEHMTEAELSDLLTAAKKCVSKMFVVVPLGKKDGSGFIIPQYDQDVTHVTIKPAEWWRNLFSDHGFFVESETYAFKGVKENWVQAHPQGNAFFVLSQS